MIVTNSYEASKHIKNSSAIALGSFDALHIGHMFIIRKTVNFAKEHGCSSVVQLFKDPVSNDKKVNPLNRRLRVLEKAGVDIVVVEDFNDDFKRIEYRSFVEKYLKEKYKAESVFAGFNYRFGFKAEGDAEKLQTECGKYGIKVFVQPCIAFNGVVSSTRIRQLIEEGKLKEVFLIMGRRYSIEGTVIRGRSLGRKIGFPTANMEIPADLVVPKTGVYETIVKIDGKLYRGITNIGEKPTVFDKRQNIETNIIGYDDDLYGREIEIVFKRRLREIRTFSNLDELKKQLEIDKKSVLERKRFLIRKK